MVSKTKRNIEWGLVVVLIVFPILRILCTDDNLKGHGHLLLPDTLVVAGSVSKERNQQLLGVVEHQQEIHIQELISNEGNRTQARILYVTAFAALVAVSFSKKGDPISDVAGYTALALALISFVLDVHLRDLGNRQVPIRDELRNTIVEITNVQPNDTTWYQLNQTKIDSQFTEAYDSRWTRKFSLALTPNTEQFVFYFLPLIVFFGLRRILE